ncbi:MAG: hypothetical protein ACRDJE_28295 [Dehalococcoidia bacterium]
MRQGLLWGGVGLLLLLTACGGGDNDADTADATATPSATGTAQPTAVALPRVFPGEQPASPETERIDTIFGGVTLPPTVDVFGRRDIPNEAIERDAPDVGLRFKEYGRETGNYYVLTVDGVQRMTLSISQYATPEGAKREFDFGKGDPAPEDRVDASGLGDENSALRSYLGSGGPQNSLYLISFTRGRYYVVIADFPPGGADAPPDTALEIARAVDEALKANPVP